MPEPMSGGSRDDDELALDLPPIDDDTNDESSAEQGEDQDVARQFEALEAEPNAEDDGAPEAGLEVGELLASTHEIHEVEDDARELDLGDAAIDLADDAPSRADDDEGGIVGEDPSLGVPDLPELGKDEDDKQRNGDGLEEEIDEAAFPELDSDDELDLPGAVDVGELEIPDEPPPLAWADVRWERVKSPLVAVPMASVCVADDVVLAAGEGAVRVVTDPQGAMAGTWITSDAIAGAALVSCCAQAGRSNVMLLASTRSLFRSRDPGRPLQPVSVPTGTAPGTGLASLCFGSVDSGLAYAVRSDGVLLVAADDGSTWRAMDGVGPVGAMCTDERGEVHLLVRNPAGVQLLVNDRTGRWTSNRLGDLPAGTDPQQATLLARRGSVIALGDTSGRITASWDGGDSWAAVRVPHTLCAVAVVPAGTVVGALYVESEDKSYLFRLNQTGPAELVADLSPDVAVEGVQEGEESEGVGQASGLAWDDNRGVLWVAGRFGLVAWRTGLAS